MSASDVLEAVPYLLGAFGLGYVAGFLQTTIRKFMEKVG